MIEQLLQRFKMVDCNPVSTPMVPGAHFEKIQECESDVPFRSLIGSLLFLAKTTRPDISFAVAKLSQFASAYSDEHWQAAKRVLRYLKGTIDLGVKYQSNPPSNEITGYSDSDYASDKSDRKSQSGFVFFFGNNLVSWRSQKQRVVACSTTEAEYIALAEATKESIWLHRLLAELYSENVKLPVRLRVDNTSAIRLANNLEFHQRSKHIDVAYHLTRGHIQDGFLEVNHVPGTQQLADGLTKALPKSGHEDMRKNIGMVCVSGMKSFLTMLCMLFTILVCVPPTLASLSTSSNVIWRPTDVPVVSGYTNVHLIVQLEDPCSVFNGTVHPDLATEFYSKCISMYESYFINELKKFCPQKGFQDHSVSKRFAITFGILIASVIATVGAGAVSVGISYHAASEVESLETELEDQISGLASAAKDIELRNERYNELKESVRTITKRLKTFEHDHYLLKNTQLEMIFGASFITSRFTTAQQIMIETERSWKSGKLHQPFLDYLNFSLPCNFSCPIHLAVPKKCVTSNSFNKIHMEFTVPMVNQSWQVVEADPFYFRKVVNDTICKLSYTGPKRLVVGKKDHCVHPARTERLDVVLAPTMYCESFNFGNLSLYESDECKSIKYDNVDDWIQVKTMYNQFHVYCPGSNLTIGNIVNACPEKPFVIPLTTSYKINDHSIVGNELHINHL